MTMTEPNEKNFNLIEATLEVLSTVVETVEGHASTDKTRTALCTVAVSPKGEWVATNGHTLALLEMDASRSWTPWIGPPEGPTLLLPAKALKQALAAAQRPVAKKLQASTRAVIRVEDGRRWTLTAGRSVTTGDLVEGLYPAWRQVWPRATETPLPYDPTGWASDVLARVAKSGSRFGDNAIFKMAWHGPLAPAVFTTQGWLGESRATLSILAMPARI
jgi:DNA polymerase III sliding clamp (beta) subunit (PCNA family)